MTEQVIIECEGCHKELIAGAPDDREEVAYGHCHGCGGYLRIKGVRRFAPAALAAARRGEGGGDGE